MKNIYVAFPGGRFKALTLSYDDGKAADRRLVSILNEHGLKGSFHLNAGLLGQADRVSAAELRGLYAGHEVSAHTFTHPTLARCPREQIARQILDDRKALEDLVGYPVRGMSYPNGSYDREIVELLPHLGIEYARAVQTTGTFSMPADFLEWQGTCHHKRELAAKGEEFLALAKSQYLYLMYVWGHSYEFDNDGNWNVIEDFAAKAGGRADIWYATNIEIVDYMNRWKAMRFSSDCSLAMNPSAVSVWLNVGGDMLEVPGGATVKLPFD
jgi:peptidoglycan/xylan/chitin deacetylase (PgdA/CDA1 family)